MLQAVVFAACSFIGSRASHVAKLLRQKYRQGTPAVRMSSSKLSFLSPTTRLVLRSVATRETIRGSIFCTISGMGKISFTLKNSAHLTTMSFSKSSGSLCWAFHGVVGWVDCVCSKLFGFWPGWIGLEDSEGIGNEGQSDPIGPNQTS